MTKVGTRTFMWGVWVSDKRENDRLFCIHRTHATVYSGHLLILILILIVFVFVELNWVANANANANAKRV